MGILDRLNKKENKQIKVAVYLRVSTEDQAEKYGLDMQKEAVLAYIKSKGQLEDGRDTMILAGDEHIYTDDGISGTKPMEERKDFWRLKENITMYPKGNCPFDAVAVYKIDRLARKLTVLLDIVKLFDDSDISLISVNESIDTSTPFGRAILGIMGVIAELEVETIKMRSAGGKIAARHKGRYQGTAPYGYKKDEEKHLYEFPEESKNVKNIFRWCVFEGKNTREIGELLSSNKIVSPEISAINNHKRKGKSRKLNNDYFWRNETVKEILSDEIYIGNYWFGKTVDRKAIPRDKWKFSEYKLPPLIEETIFYSAQKRLKDSANKILLSRKREEDTLYLLSGLLKCGWCQKHSLTKEAHTWNGNKKEVGKNSGNYSYYYKCGHKDTSKYTTTCPTIPIPAEQLESYIVAFIKNLLKNPTGAFEHQKQLRSNQLQVKQIEEERNNLINSINEIPIRSERISKQHEMGAIDDDEFILRREIIQKDIRDLNKRLKEVNTNLGKQALSNGYIRSFEEYSKKYSKALDDVVNNKNDVYILIHSIIEEIIVNTRSLDSTVDNIAGRKKENQQIPNGITIKLRLPQELLRELVNQNIKHLEDKFAVRTPTL